MKTTLCVVNFMQVKGFPIQCYIANGIFNRGVSFRIYQRLYIYLENEELND